MPSSGFGLFTGALGRAIGEALGGMARGALTEEDLRSQLGERRMLEQLHPYRVRAAEHREALYPYEQEATRLGAAALPEQMEHGRWQRGEERRKADLAAPFEKETLEYETAVLRQKAALPKELRDAVAAAQMRKGAPLTIAEQLEIGQSLAPDFETYKTYTLGLAGIAKAEQNAEAARHQRATQEAMLRYWQTRQQAQGGPKTTVTQKPPQDLTGQPGVRASTQLLVNEVVNALSARLPGFRAPGPQAFYPPAGRALPKTEIIAHEIQRRTRRQLAAEVIWDPARRMFVPLRILGAPRVEQRITGPSGASAQEAGEPKSGEFSEEGPGPDPQTAEEFLSEVLMGSP